MAGPEQAFRVKPNHRNTAPPLDGKQASAKLILYIRIFPDAHGKNHVEDKQEPEKDRSNFVVKLMAKKVDRRINRKIYRCRHGGGKNTLIHDMNNIGYPRSSQTKCTNPEYPKGG